MKRTAPAVRELVVHTGLRHGFLFKLLEVWVKPVTEWARSGELSAGDSPAQ